MANDAINREKRQPSEWETNHSQLCIRWGINIQDI